MNDRCACVRVTVVVFFVCVYVLCICSHYIIYIAASASVTPAINDTHVFILGLSLNLTHGFL